ncbi:MAG: bifunctional DNA primase/polymerase [Acidimicrobiales bacterium]
MSALGEAAGAYALRGWLVLPLQGGGKHPDGRLAPRGLHDASADPAVVEAWWKRAPAANVGLRTGVSFDVLDIDGPEALDRLDRWRVATFDPDDRQYLVGPQVATPRGWHAYVAPTGRGNGAGVGGLTGVDFRGARGYVVAPPSVRADGATWAWLDDLMLHGPDAPILPAPAWLIALLDRPRHPPPVPAPNRMTRDPHPYARRAIEAECGRVVLAPEGARNDTLNRAAHALGQLVGARMLDAHTAGDALLAAAVRCGLGEAEAIATIRSGLAAGIRNPRRAKAG